MSIQSYPSPARSSAGRAGAVTASAVSAVRVWVMVSVFMRWCSVSLGRGGCLKNGLPLPPTLLCLSSGGWRRVRARTKLFAGGRGGSGDRPASPLPPLFWLLAKLAELWPTEACLPAGQGVGNSRRKSATKERRREIRAPRAPTKEGLDGPERTRTIRQDSS